MAASTRYTFNTGPGALHLQNAVVYAIHMSQELARAYAIAVQVTANTATPANLDGSAEFGTAAGQGASLLPDMVSLNTAIATFNTSMSAILAKIDRG